MGEPLDIPPGKWIICGYGRMGKWLKKSFNEQGIKTVIIDSVLDDNKKGADYIKGEANHETLVQAGIHDAAGIVVGTGNDHTNLSILLSVQALKPDIFTIVRQNSHVNQIVFDAAQVNLNLQSSLTTARRILKHVISPHIQLFVDYMQKQSATVTHEVANHLINLVGQRYLHLWQIRLDREEAITVVDYLVKHPSLTLGELLKDPYDLGQKIHCIPFAIKRDSGMIMLPTSDTELQEDDEILLCGNLHSETLLSATINNPYTLLYLVTGQEEPRGYFFQWLNHFKSKAEG